MGSDLIEARRQLGTETDRRVLVALAAAGDAGRSPAALVELTAIPARTVSTSVNRLARRGLAKRRGPRSQVFATSAGRAEAGAGLPGVAVTPALERSVALLPSEAHRAFVRLLLSGVIARHHLRRTHLEGWGSFVAIGPTKTGKTATAVIVCKILGLSQPLSIRDARAETPLSVWGRRIPLEGGGYVIEPSSVLAQPFLCLDEFDKAAADLRQRLVILMQGNTVVAAGEGDQLLEIAPTVLLCANGTVKIVHEAYRRRSVVLDTGPLVPLLDGLPETMRTLTAGALPRLDVDRLVPPCAELPGDVHREMLVALRAGLTEQGNRLLDERAVEGMALGRAALTPGGDLRQAALATAADYLTCAATVDETLPSTPRVILEALSAPGSLLPAPRTAALELAQRGIERQAKQREDGQLVMARSAYAEELRQADLAIRQVPVPLRARAKGIRDGLQHYRTQVLAQRTGDGLVEIDKLARPVWDLAVGLAGEVDADRTARKARKDQAAADRRNQRVYLASSKAALAQAAQTERTIRRQRDAQLSRHRAELQRIYVRSRPKAGENVLGLLEELGCVERVERTGTRPVGFGLIRPVREQEVVVVSYRDRAGHEHTKAALARVGTPAVRQVLEADAAAYGLTLEPRKFA